MPACMGIVGQIASVTSLEALTAKPDAVNGSDLQAKLPSSVLRQNSSRHFHILQSY
jgi:hypothetical protein